MLLSTARQRHEHENSAIPRIVYRRQDIREGDAFLKFRVLACSADGGVCGRLHFCHAFDTGERIFYHSPPNVPVQEAWQQAWREARALGIPVILVLDPMKLFEEQSHLQRMERT